MPVKLVVAKLPSNVVAVTTPVTLTPEELAVIIPAPT